jgi:hypothetical protein
LLDGPQDGALVSKGVQIPFEPPSEWHRARHLRQIVIERFPTAEPALVIDHVFDRLDGHGWLRAVLIGSFVVLLVVWS